MRCRRNSRPSHPEDHAPLLRHARNGMPRMIMQRVPKDEAEAAACRGDPGTRDHVIAPS
jgi:hypothetical protein